MGNKDENLKELFDKFTDGGQAQKSADDIVRGEGLLSEHPAPQPSAELLSSIKAQINRKLQQPKRRSFAVLGYGAVAAAAAVLLVGSIAIKILNKPAEIQITQTASLVPAEVWESDDLSKDDPELALLAAQMQELEDEVLALQTGENGFNGLSADEIEIEFMEIDSDFWKG